MDRPRRHCRQSPRLRHAPTLAFEAADAHCSDQLLEAVSEAVPAIDPDRPLLPTSLGEACAQCGRHHDERCGEGCPWISSGDGTDADGPTAPGIPWMV